jgi:flagellar biosynthetic protein FliQ
MSEGLFFSLAHQALMLTFQLAAPPLLTIFFVGFLTSIIQAATQIHEPTLSFIPKVLALGLILWLTGPWMLHRLLDTTRSLWEHL